MKSIKQIFTKIYLTGMKKLLFYTNPEFKMYEDILNIRFLEIEHPKLNHFNSDDLSKYIDFGYNYYIPSKCNKVKKLLDKLILKDEFISKINLTKINSLNASKSKKIHESIYLFGQHVCVKENVGWTFDECINHVLEDHKLLYLYYYSWNDKYYWINSGGSHHFAVANYIATNEKIDYFFDCNIASFHIDEETVKELINNYELFIIHKKISYNFTQMFNRDRICILQNRQDNEVLIALTKDELLQDKVIDFLKKLDDKYIFNVNNYLSELILKQKNRVQNKI